MHRSISRNAAARLRFLGSWALALALVGLGLPRVVAVSWHGVVPVLQTIHWPWALALSVLWLLGLWVHSFVLTAAAPNLTHGRALALNVTGSAVSNVVPLGGAAGVELNRRMMRAWGIDARDFAGYTLLTNLWDVGAKLVLPVIGVVVLAQAGEAVSPQLRTAAVAAGVGFVGLAAVAAALLASPRAAAVIGGGVERVLRRALRLVRRDRPLGLPEALVEIRHQSAGLVARGWLRMSVGISGYVALQALLLGVCLHLTGAGSTPADVLAGFAVERLLTIIPITPGGIGLADLGLVGVLLTLGGDPAGVTAAAVLYRLFIFVVEIPVGGGTLGVWLLGQRRVARQGRVEVLRPVGAGRRVAHVTDVFLPRLGGIETHVDDLVRQQRAAGIDAQVLTPTDAAGPDPDWVRRLSAREARHVIGEYDVAHVHVSMFSPYGLAVARAAMAAGVPTLITVHSMWVGAGGVLRLAALASLRRWPVAWSAVSGAAAACLTRSLRNVDVAVLPNAIDVASWRPAVTSAVTPALTPAVGPALTRPVTSPAISAGTSGVEVATDPDEPVTVVSVMRLMPRKRPVQLLEMFARVQQLTAGRARLVIVGDGPMRRRMERYVRRHRLGQQVRITGRLPRDRVREELVAASVYVAPATRESFGLAALEARCAGLPVVAHRRSGVTEFVRDRVDGVLVGDDTEMAAAIADLVVDEDLRARISAHNQRVAPACDWDDALRRTDALYRQAATRARATAAPDRTELPAVVAAEA